MTEKEQAEFDLYAELYFSKGWKQFIADLEESRTEIGKIESIKDAKELHVLQGKLLMVDTILNMEHMMGLAKEQAEGGYDEIDI